MNKVRIYHNAQFGASRCRRTETARRAFVTVRFCISALVALASCSEALAQQPALGARYVAVLTLDGSQFRDLNKNGRVDPYEDWRRPAQDRTRDLVSRMTIEEKAGVMVHASLSGTGTAYDMGAARESIMNRHINTFITRLAASPETLAAQNNSLQGIAEGTRLGIPLTISTDPRHHFQFVEGASVAPGAFSQWPETSGFAAIGDAALVRRFGDIARQEYRAVGITAALSPQADLATEPRWPRINGTFGEDADLAGKMVEAYVIGFQNGAQGLNPSSVMTVVKHWAAYGAAHDGFDAHNYYGRYADLSGGNFFYHVKPFEPALAAQVAGVMPTYTILRGLTVEGKPVEPVGGAFNKWLLTDLLRGRYGFSGVILSDWAVTQDCNEECRNGAPRGQEPSRAGIATSWGVEHLTSSERFAKAINAGVDQIGGTEDVQSLLAAIRAKHIGIARIDASVARILEQKFLLGLFENPYADPDRAKQVVGAPAFAEEAQNAQSRSLVLLENEGQVLPLQAAGRKVYLHGIAPAVARSYGFTVVSAPEAADVALVRANAPFEKLHPGYFFGSRQHEGRLNFQDGDAEYELIEAVSRVVPTIVTVYLDRPAVLTPIRDKARVLIGNFGASDTALLDVVTGRKRAEGRLPFELPASMEAVLKQKSDVPHDTVKPLYPIFYRVED